MSSGIGIGISSSFGGTKGLPSDFSYPKIQFCDDDNSTYTPTPANPGGTWSITPALTGFNTSTGAFSPYAIAGPYPRTFVITHTLSGDTSTEEIFINEADVIIAFSYPFTAYPQSGIDPLPTVNPTGGTFTAAPAGLSINASSGEINLSESSLNTYVITYTSSSEFCPDTSTFTLEVESPYVGFKFRIVVPAGAAQTLALETVNGASAAPNSIINWGDGSVTQPLTTTTASNSFPTGTYDIEINAFNSVAPVNNFSVTSANALVTEVLDWGGTPWLSLVQAFKGCNNLTTFGTGTFSGNSGGVNLTSCFENCTSLTSIDMRNWDLSNGSTMDSFAEECSVVTDVYLPALTPMKGSWESAFDAVGTAVTVGCAFNLEALDFTGSVGNNSMGSMFQSSRINPSSNFTNWVFGVGTEISSAGNMFRLMAITGVNPVLDVSGWLDFPAKNPAFMFFGTNGGASLASASGITIEKYTLNITNLNTSSATSLNSFIANPNSGANELGLKSIIGLSTLNASASVTSISSLMFFQKNLTLTVADNLPDVFMDSLNLSSSGFNSPFRDLGSLLTTGYGAAPNLSALNLTNVTTLVNCFRLARFSTNIDFSNVTFGTSIILYYAFNAIKFSNTDSHIEFPNVMTIKGNNCFNNAFSNAVVRKITFSNNVDFSECEDFNTSFNAVKGSEDADPATTEINLPTNISFAGASLTNTATFNSFLSNVKGPGSTGTVAANWNALDSCQTNNLLRNLKISLPTPGADADIVLNNCKYSGPQALVSDDYDTLTTNGWTFGSLSPEAPYFTLSSYSLRAGSTTQATINAAYTGGTFTSSNTAVATVNATGLVTSVGEPGTCQIIYTLADGTCYNEVNLAVAIPLIANNFSFNFDGINDFLSVDNSLVEDDFINVPYLTFSSWFYGNNIPTAAFRALFTNIQYGSGRAGFALVIPSGQSDFSIRYHGSTTRNDFNTGITLPGNQWNHISVTVAQEGSFGGTDYNQGILIFYLNGVAVAFTTSDLSTGLSYPASGRESGTGTNIGSNAYPTMTSSFWNGKIDEVAMWNTPLTGPQILDIYNGRLGVQNETIDLSKYPTSGDNLIYWNRMGD